MTHALRATIALLAVAFVISLPGTLMADTQNSVHTTESGLRYTDEMVGTGPEAKAGENVSVHYTGWLLKAGDEKGQKFDSSLDRGKPFQFPLGAGRVIKGWDEGVAGMKVGGKRMLYIPSSLGYGARGAGAAIPPGADLVFEVELLNVQGG